MAVPSPTSPCWLRLANGGLSRLRTNHLGTQMMIKRLERSSDPADRKAAEIREYFTKWGRGMPDEVAQLERL